jgi:ribonuclease BN (tRNA processing enzyme)
MSDFRVTLLGTGTPISVPVHFGLSTLVEAGDQELSFDAGCGAQAASARRANRGIDALLLVCSGILP